MGLALGFNGLALGFMGLALGFMGLVFGFMGFGLRVWVLALGEWVVVGSATWENKNARLGKDTWEKTPGKTWVNTHGKRHLGKRHRTQTRPGGAWICYLGLRFAT